MAGFKESNITLDFPTAKWFRFEKSEPYAQLSGFDFKEMDACWYEDTEGDRDVFYAIELKDYRAVTIGDDNTVAVRKYNLVKKTVDTMQMLLAAQYQTPFGEILEREKRVDLHSRPIEYYFVVIICEKTENSLLLQSLKEVCIKALRPYMQIWGNSHFLLMTDEQAKQRFNFVH